MTLLPRAQREKRVLVSEVRTLRGKLHGAGAGNGLEAEG